MITDTLGQLCLGRFTIHFMPRLSWTPAEFAETAPPNSIALNRMVRGGPSFDMANMRVNFDHHDGVVREVTMSTAMQVFHAIKGGMIDAFKGTIHVWVNDTDRNTSLALWLLIKHAEFKGTKCNPHISRLLALTDQLDITGSAFPMRPDDELSGRDYWVSKPYTDLCQSGHLAHADEVLLRDNFDAMLHHLDLFMMGCTFSTGLDTKHAILYEDTHFKIVDGIGGDEARYHLYSLGINAFVGIAARLPDGRMVCRIGRRSQWIIYFDLPKIYNALNAAEGIVDPELGWNGSTISGGTAGTKLTVEQIRDTIKSTIQI